MPHEVVIDGARFAVDDVLDVGRADGTLLLRAHRLADGDVVVVAAGEASRDGRPLVGGLAVVPWGAAALLRLGHLRVDVTWRAATERCVAFAGARCRVCFDDLRAAEPAVSCACAALFHLPCDGARVDCPACGRPRADGAT
jgi:hypothetical protein